MWMLGAKIRQFSDLSIVTPINLYEIRHRNLCFSTYFHPFSSVFAQNIWLFNQKLVSLHPNLNKILGLVAQLVRATDS